MWPLPPLNKSFVSVVFSPQNLTCSWIQRSNKKAPLTLRAHKQHNLQNLELEKSNVFNPTQIKQYIVNFLTTYNLKHSFVSFALSGPQIQEQFVTLTTATPHRDNFSVSNNPHMHWQWTYVYPNDAGKFTFYLCGIPQQLLFQYKLLASSTPLNLLTISTPRMALLQLYRFIYGSAFRHAQLAIDMQRYHNIIEQLFTHDTIARIVHIPEISNEKLLQHILTSCGLFVSEGMV